MKNTIKKHFKISICLIITSLLLMGIFPQNEYKIGYIIFALILVLSVIYLYLVFILHLLNYEGKKDKRKEIIYYIYCVIISTTILLINVFFIEEASSILAVLFSITNCFGIYYFIKIIKYYIQIRKIKKKEKNPDNVCRVLKKEEYTQIKPKTKRKKYVYRTPDDKLYDEAVKYFGKSYVKHRSKDDVIEEYLCEDNMVK